MLETAHHRMPEAGVVERILQADVAVPGHDVEIVGPLRVVVSRGAAEEIRRDRRGRVVAPDGVLFHDEFRKLGFAEEPRVVEERRGQHGQVLVEGVPQPVRRYDLIERSEGMAPERAGPRLVEGLDRSIAVLQPDAERRGAVRAVAEVLVFVRYMPRDDGPAPAVTFGQPIHKALGETAEHRAVRARVVALAVGLAAAFEIDAIDLLEPLGQPRRQRGGGGRQFDGHAVALGAVDDPVEVPEVVRILGRLQANPSEDVERQLVDAGLGEQIHVAVPRRFRPLLVVVVAAEQHRPVGRYRHAGPVFLAICPLVHHASI